MASRLKGGRTASIIGIILQVALLFRTEKGVEFNTLCISENSMKRFCLK